MNLRYGTRVSSGIEERGGSVKRDDGKCPATGLPHKWGGKLSATQLSKLENMHDMASSEYADHVMCEDCELIKIIHFDK
jgi:hypothetical protein